MTDRQRRNLAVMADPQSSSLSRGDQAAIQAAIDRIDALEKALTRIVTIFHSHNYSLSEWDDALIAAKACIQPFDEKRHSVPRDAS